MGGNGCTSVHEYPLAKFSGFGDQRSVAIPDKYGRWHAQAKQRAWMDAILVKSANDAFRTELAVPQSPTFYAGSLRYVTQSPIAGGRSSSAQSPSSLVRA